MVEVKNKVCLIAIDGWGVNATSGNKGDAVEVAKTPVMDMLRKDYPYRTLGAHGLSVGLPDGLMGNSEVGHLNIGAGRVVYQDIVRIDLALKNNEFGKLPNIKACFETAKNKSGRLHFCGLVSNGGVHSHIKHLFGLLKAAKEAGVPESFVHVFCDGRDCHPRSSDKFIKQLQDEMKTLNYGKIAVIVGRYYAMDRDKRWERVQLAFDAMTKGLGEKTSDPLALIAEKYAKDETDEFFKPMIVNEDGLVRSNDSMFFFDFRADRMREISQVFGVSPPPFETEVPTGLEITTLTQYKGDFPFQVAFPPQRMDDVLGEWLAKQGVAQSHVAETEKYAHVTFFFNGGTEAQYNGEHRVLIPSPRVATYDLQPQMSAALVAEGVVAEIETGKFPFVMCNFAPPDMVGHTGVMSAAVTAVEATDAAIGVIYEACQKHGYTLFVTADHGNAETMIDENGGPCTSHTCNRVPLNITANVPMVEASEGDALCDVAPSILRHMGLPIPEAMTGHSIVQ